MVLCDSPSNAVFPSYQSKTQKQRWEVDLVAARDKAWDNIEVWAREQVKVEKPVPKKVSQFYVFMTGVDPHLLPDATPIGECRFQPGNNVPFRAKAAIIDAKKQSQERAQAKEQAAATNGGAEKPKAKRKKKGKTTAAAASVPTVTAQEVQARANTGSTALGNSVPPHAAALMTLVTI